MEVVVRSPRQDDIWLVSLDPTRGTEIKKTRPCLIVSPDEMNLHLRIVIVAPMTTTLRAYPTRAELTFQGKRGQIALDQLRAIDFERLLCKLGAISQRTGERVSAILLEMFGRKP